MCHNILTLSPIEIPKGNVVFFGELGQESQKLIKYFEDRGAKGIEKQENPAAWVLRAYAGEEASNQTDWGELYKSSEQCNLANEEISSIREKSDEKGKITYSSTFSTPMSERVRLMCQRMDTIYRRSAPYNMTRIVVSILYAFLVGSMFITSAYKRQNFDWSETQAAGIVGTIFLSLNVVGTTGEIAE